MERRVVDGSARAFRTGVREAMGCNGWWGGAAKKKTHEQADEPGEDRG